MKFQPRTEKCKAKSKDRKEKRDRCVTQTIPQQAVANGGLRGRFVRISPLNKSPAPAAGIIQQSRQHHRVNRSRMRLPNGQLPGKTLTKIDSFSPLRRLRGTLISPIRLLRIAGQVPTPNRSGENCFRNRWLVSSPMPRRQGRNVESTLVAVASEPNRTRRRPPPPVRKDNRLTTHATTGIEVTTKPDPS